MKMTSRIIGFVLLFVVAGHVNAQSYPDMVGKWEGNVRVVTAGTNEVAKGGMEISEVRLTLTITHQDEESFMGRSRTSATPPDVRSTDVWGTIRSTGREALFIASNGARGQVWFQDQTRFEFCVTNAATEQVTAYCAELEKKEE